eukprot:PLAT1714.1.p1 GENE.PLAT1714.1~~PLAT1714.1.p1  ORF type:complete len:534 (+),score=304.19 PLAT1714.1:47-1648(+)
MATSSVLDEEAEVDKGEHARMSSIIGAIAVADLVKTTLGPKGMDKILQPVTGESEVTVTNDGATILRSLYVDNAAAKVLVDIAKSVDEEVGDGTTSVVVFTGELLREADKLIQRRIHPQTIAAGWRLATKIATDALEASAVDHGDDAALLRADLVKIAMTTLSSKILTHEKEYFAELAVDAILRLDGGDLEHIQIIKKQGGALRDSYLEDGFLLEKKLGIGQPKRMEDVKILIGNTDLSRDKVKIFSTRVRVDSMDKVAAIEEAEREKMAAKVAKICAHDINVFINRQLIYNYPEQLFTEAGVTSIEHADFDGIERLAAVTGGEICSTFDSPDDVTIGHADVLEEIMIGEDKVLRFSGCAGGRACTIVLRGASQHILDEADRSLHDALAVLSQTVKETATVLGGGCSEMLMSRAIDEVVPTISGKKALALESFSTALRQMPAILADNAGYDSAELVTALRAAHTRGEKTAGLDMEAAVVGDVEELGIKESLRMKRTILVSAAEAAEMVLRVDDIIKCAPRRREGGGGHGMGMM